MNPQKIKTSSEIPFSLKQNTKIMTELERPYNISYCDDMECKYLHYLRN